MHSAFSADAAAKLAAKVQAAPVETTQTSYEDENGRWYNEVDSGTDRPKAKRHILATKFALLKTWASAPAVRQSSRPLIPGIFQSVITIG